MSRSDVGQYIVEWLMAGKTVEPRFGEWSESIGACRCQKENVELSCEGEKKMKSKAAAETERAAADCPRYNQRLVLLVRTYMAQSGPYEVSCNCWPSHHNDCNVTKWRKAHRELEAELEAIEANSEVKRT